LAPKIKTSSEDIVAEAICIVRESGMEAVNARSVAARLNCSIQPIFRNFDTMDELKAAVCKRAEEIFNTAMLNALDNDSEGLLAMGLAYVNFAKSAQNIFRLLFMSNVFNKGSAIDIPGSTEGDDRVIAHIGKLTDLNEAKSRELYAGIWFMAHGMASFLATNDCTLSEDEIKTMLKNTYNGFLYSINNGE